MMTYKELETLSENSLLSLQNRFQSQIKELHDSLAIIETILQQRNNGSPNAQGRAPIFFNDDAA